ncbi:MAG: GTP-binding protein [Microcoleaceae cyanobacterium]
MVSPDSQNNHIQHARNSLRQSLSRISQMRRQKGKDTELQATLQTQLDILNASLKKLDQCLIRIAVFGLVSRGKSAVLNALLGESLLQTGPLNGVTQWPRSVRWDVVTGNGSQDNIIPVELIDTPGLDEVGGEVRGDMAREVTRQADLILFVVSGDLTRTEHDALCELRLAQKPLIVVFNKIDLYTEAEQVAIIENLRQVVSEAKTSKIPLKAPSRLSQAVLEVVKVAAEPAPIPVRVQWPDGRVSSQWEAQPPNIEELRQIIVSTLRREGRSLLALNALVQARSAEKTIAYETVQLQQVEADDLIWQFTKYKALAVAFNPIAILDVLGTSMADLLLIRSLARLYGLPMTSYEAGKLLQKILLSSGGMLLAELGSGLLLGFGKSAAGLATDISTYAGVAITQASIAAYGTYTVGKAAQVYLEQGCTWGEFGIDTVIQEILNQVDKDTVIHQLKQELKI